MLTRVLNTHTHCPRSLLNVTHNLTHKTHLPLLLPSFLLPFSTFVSLFPISVSPHISLLSPLYLALAPDPTPPLSAADSC
jgi:hypothetical protein